MQSRNKLNPFFFILILLLTFCVVKCDKKSTTEPEDRPGPVTDVDGNIYSTVKIGNQWWLKKNLEVTHYRNGDAIPNVTDDSTWANLTTGAYCSYDNDPANAETCGYLYNWYAVNDPRGLAPEGWHVASDSEWVELIDRLGGNEVAGGKLKSTGTTLWEAPNTDATNMSAFSALPGGGRGRSGNFGQMGRQNLFWTSTERSPSSAWGRAMFYNNSGVGRGDSPYRRGQSVRCVRD